MIRGAIDGEVSFGQICANFGAGLLVGAATGALTGLVVGKINFILLFKLHYTLVTTFMMGEFDNE